MAPPPTSASEEEGSCSSFGLEEEGGMEDLTETESNWKTIERPYGIHDRSQMHLKMLELWFLSPRDLLNLVGNG